MKKTLCILLAAALILALAGCFGSADETASYNDAGTYEVYMTTDGAAVMTRADYAAQDWAICLRLGADGKGELDMGGGDVRALTWSDGSLTMGGETVAYTAADGMLALALSGSGGPFVMLFQREDLAAASAAAQTAAEPEPVPEPGGGDLLGCHVEFVAAEAFTNAEGKPAVRFYYDFTNTSSVPAGAWMTLRMDADEDGYPLMYTYADMEDDVPEYGNSDLSVLPGVTVRCVNEYTYNPDGRLLTLTLTDSEDRTLSGTFDAQALAGRPGDWSPEAVPSPDWYGGLDSAGDTESAHIAIDRAETAAGDPESGTGGRVLRVYFDYANLGEYDSFITNSLSITAYQDGIALPIGFAAQETFSDQHMYDDVAPGGELSASRCWALRSDSPVLVLVTNWMTEEPVCAAVFPADGAVG